MISQPLIEIYWLKIKDRSNDSYTSLSASKPRISKMQSLDSLLFLNSNTIKDKLSLEINLKER